MNKFFEFRSKILHEFKILFLIFLCIMSVRSSLVELYKIPTGSMIPTLLPGDFIIVDKMAYGLKIPFTEWFFHPVYLTNFKQPERGDVIVFNYPLDKTIFFVKRVIGLPGDKIEIKNKFVWINGKQIVTVKIKTSLVEEEDQEIAYAHFNFFKNTFEGKEFNTQLFNENLYKANWGPAIIPENNYFVMGDNRDFSRDSRFWGFVQESFIKGKAIRIGPSLRIPPNNNVQITFRGDRFGKKIE